MPGRNGGEWGEVTSTSNCTDYQTRRLNIKYKDDDGKNKYVHMLNGTAIAISRGIIAVLENCQQADGTVRIPAALVPYVGFEVMMGKQVDHASPEEYTGSMHRYSILFEEITDPAFPEGWHYANMPTLNLTTHGKGLEGARAAAVDLLQLWFAEKQANGEEIPQEPTVYYTQVEIPDALQIS